MIFARYAVTLVLCATTTTAFVAPKNAAVALVGPPPLMMTSTLSKVSVSILSTHHKHNIEYAVHILFFYFIHHFLFINALFPSSLLLTPHTHIILNQYNDVYTD
jgi:hypothetical protein